MKLLKPKFTYQWIYESVEWPPTHEGVEPDPVISYDSDTVVVTTDVCDVEDQLQRESWDHLDERGDGTVICYPADSHQDMMTGVYTSNQLIIKGKRRHINKLMKHYATGK